MDENSIKQAIELLQKARDVLEDAWLADDSVDSAGIAMANEQLDDLIRFVDGLIAPVIAPAGGVLNDEPTPIETIRDWAQIALSSLIDKRPSNALAELKHVLEGIGPDSLDLEVIKQAINRLEKIVCEITEVEDLLNKTNFTFGNIRALPETPVEAPWDDDPPHLN
jgi:hypothetical protein